MSKFTSLISPSLLAKIDQVLTEENPSMDKGITTLAFSLAGLIRLASLPTQEQEILLVDIYLFLLQIINTPASQPPTSEL